MGTTKVTTVARYIKNVQQWHLLLGITNSSLLGPKGLFDRGSACLVQCSKPRPVAGEVVEPKGELPTTIFLNQYDF